MNRTYATNLKRSITDLTLSRDLIPVCHPSFPSDFLECRIEIPRRPLELSRQVALKHGGSCYCVSCFAKTGSLMTDTPPPSPLVGVIMGSKSDWETMRHAAEVLIEFGVSHECRVVSAHRTPELMNEYATSAESRGLKIIIAGAGGAAHLPGMIASQTVLPVLGVPVQSRALNGMDSLLSIVQMPGGIPVGTLAIGEAGARNAGLLAIRILATTRPELVKMLHDFQKRQRDRVLGESLT